MAARPAQGGYGQNPYGDQGYAGAGAGRARGSRPSPTGASGWRAYLIDGVLIAVAMIPYFIGAGLTAGGASSEVDPVTGEVVTTMGEGSGLGLALMGLGLLLMLGFVIWNTFIKQGKTGYTIGKGVMGIKLVKAETGQPIGAGMAFVRQLAHIVDSLPCYIGFLWPLWDAKRQTFADKIIGTYVIDQPKG